jgi:hypothetical protein
MIKRNLTLKQDPSDRTKLLDGNGNLAFICVTGFPGDADVLLKVWNNAPDLKELVSKLTTTIEEAQKTLSECDGVIDDINDLK